MSLVAELQRRRVFRALVGYGVAAFAVLQIAEPIMHGFHWPDAVLSYVVAALAVGFPVVVILAWIFDVNAGRVERTAPAGGVGRTKLALTLLAIGIAAAAPGVAWYLYKRGGPQKPSAGTAQGAPSIAVLSFADLSPEHNQDYFSDGIAEEILNALARVKGLRVAGRTSSFQFKGKNEDLRAIGETLGVANVLEGSVRKQGSRVRITAQLIQVADGFHLWSNTFDGELTDVFALQESIARAITGELKVVLQGQNARLVPVATADPEAYALYLQATAVINRRDYARMREVFGWLDQALARDPKFARAHARLAMAHALNQRAGAVPAEAERHAKLASDLDPLLAEPWVAVGLIRGQERRFLEAREAFSHASELEPDDAFVNLHAAQELIRTGYTKAGIARLDHALEIDPVLPNALFWRGVQASFAGDQDKAQRMLDRAASLGLSFANIGLSEVWLARGDRTRARGLFTSFTDLNPECLKDPDASVRLLVDAIYGADPAALDRALPVVQACLDTHEPVSAWVPRLLYGADPARAVQVIGRGPTANEANVLMTLWSPIGRAARRTPGFAEFTRRAGLAELWDRYGPPDLCRRAGEREYQCE